MDTMDAFKNLKNMFVATFLDELMPGIFHNFANPLNGIMGRAKLMQRRLTDYVEKMQSRSADPAGLVEQSGRKLLSDMDSIVRESDRFYDLFRAAAGKFQAIGALERERFNLSALVLSELAFADFYLDFKHNINKDIRIDHEIPDITGIAAFYSLALWALIRESANNINKFGHDTFRIVTHHDDNRVYLSLNNIGGRATSDTSDAVPDSNAGDGNAADASGGNMAVLYALKLLQECGAEIEIMHDANTGMLRILIPFRRK